jgi:site-specific recombinase XerD
MSAHIPKNSSHRRPAKHEAADYGSDRKHLTSRGVERLIEAAKGSRNEARDRCLLLLIFRHGSLPLRAHPHMLRHACGFALADQGADTRLIQDYLGHCNIQHTVKYTASNPEQFQRLWNGTGSS